MILTKYVIYRGKPKLVKDLGKNTRYKVEVECPVCHQIRTVHYRSIVAAGHCVCLKCINTIKRSIPIDPETRFSKLTVISPADRSGHSVCRCDCGNLTVVDNRNLRSGWTKSCGCLKKETLKHTLKVSGSQNGRWKGGISSARDRDQVSLRYKQWRSSVFERDDYICQKCGQRGYRLNGHHIYHYSGYKDLRYSVENGATLCKNCHFEFHTQFGLKNTFFQWALYLGIAQRVPAKN